MFTINEKNYQMQGESQNFTNNRTSNREFLFNLYRYLIQDTS